ncbi:MAG: hypothetical protein R3B40_01810 [Polyangiales bacterium]
MSTPSRPGLARTDRGVSRPLRAWLARAVQDDAALSELALAFNAHTLAERRQLASLLHRDMASEQLDPERAQALFAAMLALEEEPSLQAELVDRLRALEPAVAGFVYGDEGRGGALIARERAPARWDCLLVHWQAERATRVDYAEVDASEAADVLAGLATGAGNTPRRSGPERVVAHPQIPWRQVSARVACERLGLPLLRFTREGGALPREAERFAGMVARG